MLMIGKALTAEQRLVKATVSIMEHAPILAPILMIGKKEVVWGNTIPTAQTNGRDVLFGGEFVNELSDAELRFVLMHEEYHKMYRHLVTWRNLHDIDANIANQALDYVINLKIVKEYGDVLIGERGGKFVSMPEGGLLDVKYDGMNEKQVFDDLYKNGNGGNGKGNGENGNESSGASGAGMDDHDWKNAAEMSDEEKKDLARQVDEAVRQGALTAGKLGSAGARSLDELLQAKVNWREVLRDFVSTTCTGKDFGTWSKPNRRYLSSGYYMPSTLSERVDELIIAIDTSGSIGVKEVSQFLGEVQGICTTVKPSRIRLLYWDTRICGEEVYEEEEVERLVNSTKPAGGGGTRVSCVCNHITENNLKAQAVVVLTDGYLGSDWGTWSMPVLWCLIGNKTVPPMGKYVHVEWD
ncbi:MAG: hypothetical protein EBR82_40335 [Caulobacteraceae bacterium]|nr:hypothetical protein [Caulobacteraceae bacterium]